MSDRLHDAVAAGVLGTDENYRALLRSIVDVARALGERVVAEGVERVDEFQAMADLGVDLGQGFYFGQPTERPMAVDARLVRPRAELV